MIVLFILSLPTWKISNRSSKYTDDECNRWWSKIRANTFLKEEALEHVEQLMWVNQPIKQKHVRFASAQNLKTFSWMDLVVKVCLDFLFYNGFFYLTYLQAWSDTQQCHNFCLISFFHFFHKHLYIFVDLLYTISVNFHNKMVCQQHLSNFVFDVTFCLVTFSKASLCFFEKNHQKRKKWVNNQKTMFSN